VWVQLRGAGLRRVADLGETSQAWLSELIKLGDPRPLLLKPVARALRDPDHVGDLSSEDLDTDAGEEPDEDRCAVEVSQDMSLRSRCPFQRLTTSEICIDRADCRTQLVTIKRCSVPLAAMRVVTRPEGKTVLWVRHALRYGCLILG
jgi:hypothetical protein